MSTVLWRFLIKLWRFYSILFLLFSISILDACRIKEERGEILVRAPNPGNYEIYRIESEEPLQFVSEQIGSFNQPMQLAPGNYLVLADCSYESLVIRPRETKTLVAHQIIFNPPVVPESQDNFSIQCNRFSKTKSRQQFWNRYTLNVLQGSRDLLVGMVPMTIKFDNVQDKESPQILSYNLSGLKVEKYEGMKPKTSFFVSPVEGLLSVTETQQFGHWEFLLAGEYKVEVNGTSMNAVLKEGEQFVIQPAFLRIAVSDNVNLAKSSNIMGTPSYVELNQGHWLDLNETYPVLPGIATLKLNGSVHDHNAELIAGQMTERKVRSVLVDLDCSPWDWSCLGSRAVYLYETGKPYPFAEGISDVPLLYFEEDAWVSVQGSRDIHVKVDKDQQDATFRVGFAKLVPKQMHRHGLITDLSRMEPLKGTQMEGHSLDLSVEDDSTMPLIVGRYSLTQYHASATADWERRANHTPVWIQAGETVEVPYTVYVSEKKYKQLRERQELAKQRVLEQKFRLTQWQNRSIVPSSVN